MTATNINVFIYRLNQLLIDLNHQCNVTLTEIRQGVYTFEASCQDCDLNLKIENESINRLYTRIGNSKACSA